MTCVSRKKIAVLIPAYREGEVLIHNIDSLRKQNYSEERFEIFLINDNCDSAVIQELKKYNIKIINVSFPKSSKVKSLQAAYSHVGNDFDSVVIVDADNLVHPDFLKEINFSLTNGNVFVQGRRIAKNLDTYFSRLDYFTDTFYNFVDREWPSRLKLSATISGSGFGMERKLFFNLISKINVLGGFDKMMQLLLICSGYKIDFNANAIIYDEKVSESAKFRRQRKRWLHTHLRMLINHTPDILSSMRTKFTIDKLNHLFIILRPPLTILISMALVICALNFFFELYSMMFIWLGLLFAYFLILLTALILSKVNPRMYLALFASPVLFVNQLLSFYKIKEASQNSLHTSHSSTLTINDVISRGSK
jgi:cellulose synthase/poly-beta-1,6-N-acetylglucosamine synthase-like glycosyltransferase